MPILSPLTQNLTFNRKPLPSAKSLVKQARITPNPIERPYISLDNMDTAPYTARTAGADLTLATSTVAQLYNQLTHIVATVGATVTAETLTYFSASNTLDLTAVEPGLFDSGDEPVLVIKGYGLAGLSALTRAQAAITVSATDTAGTPVTFASSGTPNATLKVDARLSQLATNENVLTGTEDLTNDPFQAIIPLSVLAQSTTKIFSQLQIKFNFPAGSTFAIYKIAIYRSLEDYEGSERKPIYITYPDSSSVKRTSTTSKAKDGVGFLRGVKAKAKDMSFEVSGANIGIDEYRSAIGEQRITGGKKISQDYPFALAASITNLGDLGNVTKIQDLAVFYTDDSGIEKPMPIVSGSFVDRSYCGFVVTATGAKLYFNAVDVAAGFKGRVVFYTKDNSRFILKEKALSTVIRGRVDFNVSDATEIGLGAQELNDMKDVFIEIERELGSITDDKVNLSKFTITPVATDAKATINEISYKLGE